MCVWTEAPASYLRILHSLRARSCVRFMPLDVCTLLPTQTSSKSRPKLFHPIITLPQLSSSYSPLPFSLHHSNVISFTLWSYNLPSYLPSFTILRHPTPSDFSAILCHPIWRWDGKGWCCKVSNATEHFVFTLLLPREVVVSQTLNVWARN